MRVRTYTILNLIWWEVVVTRLDFDDYWGPEYQWSIRRKRK